MELSRTSAVAVALLSLAACGGDDGGSDAGGADAAGGEDAATGDDGAVADGGAVDGAATDGGGGASIPIVPGYASGGRLEVVAAGTDGSPGAFLHFHDTALDVPCGFSMAADGVLRCLPLNRTGVNAWPPWYTDAACTDRLRTGVVPDCAPLPWAYTNGEPVDACRTAVTNPVVRLEPLEVPAEVWTDESGACTGPAAPEPVPAHVFREVAPWPAEEFVAAEERTQVIDERLSVRTVVTAEGAGRVVGLVDAMHGPCYPRPTASHGTRCLPTDSLTTGPTAQYFLDAACTAQPAVPGRSRTALPGCDRTDPSVATWFEVGDGGVIRHRVHRLGAAVEGTVYRASDCGAVETDTLDTAVYPLGDEITSELISFTETRVGDGPVQARFLATEAGPAFPMGKLYDRERALPCDPIELDGALRCVPARWGGSQILYADAACTEPVNHDYVSSAEPLRVVFLGEGTACDPANLQAGSTPWEVGALYEGTLYGFGTGPCAEAPRVAGDDYHRITPLDASTLPALSR